MPDVQDHQPLIDDDAIAEAFGALDDGYEDEDDLDPREDDRFDTSDAPDDTDEGDQLDLEDDEEDEDTDADADEEEVAEDAEEDGDFEEYEVSDDHSIVIKVNGEEQEFSVGQLKRLAGQEAAITQKAQNVAEMRRSVERQDQLAKVSYEKLLSRVNEKLKPYEGLDLVKIARNPNVTDAQLEAIKTEMAQLNEEKTFLEQGLDAHVKSLDEHRQQTQLAAAKEAITQIEDQASPFYVENFRDRYNDLKAHAIKQGADEEFINNLIDPWTWKVISDSLAFTSTKQKAEAKRQERKPKASAKKTKRSRGSERDLTGRKGRKTAALKRLRANPRSERAIADAFGALDE